MEQQILQAVQTALQGSRQINITFKEEAVETSYILYLLEMHIHGNILLKSSDVMMLRHFSQDIQWKNGCGYIMTITLTKEFNEDLFIKQMHPALKEIEAVN